MNLKYAKRSEDTEQIAVIQWAQWHMNEYPELKWLHHCPNGGSRNQNEAVKFKQMGVKAGVSDLHLPYPKGIYCGLYIEMKFGKNGYTGSQEEFLADMAEVGHFVATCYSTDEAIAVIEKYLSLENWVLKVKDAMLIQGRTNGKIKAITSRVMDIPNNSILKGGKVK